jgi:hypothetical protein
MTTGTTKMTSDNDSEASSVRGSDSELSEVDFGVDDKLSFLSYDSDEDELCAIAGSLQDEDNNESRGPPEDNYAEPMPTEPPENIEFATDDAENNNDDELDPPAEETPPSNREHDGHPIPCNKSIAHWYYVENDLVI